jgi:ATP-dependent DNA helicase RecQ
MLDCVRRVWGFDSLRPLQEEAIRAGHDHHDSLVVMPTGGGKSLCYQVPPLLADRTDIVISPLISLMKDQVDGLQAAGYPAAALHSNLAPQERRQVEERAAAGALRLLFIAPERLMTEPGLQLAGRLRVRAFAIDEAHCISHWGHDFRREYRQLAVLNERFPSASVHAFTATATLRVREDIITQLRLRDPVVLVGSFDRPNLTYRILPLHDRYAQVTEVIQRHDGEAVIVYCISRKDTERMAAALNACGIRAAHYHAGMEAAERRRVQDEFSEEKVNVIAATVAFGMGIDRSNVRCVIHASMPKTIEHYQQETGRAGRDGLEAECVLLYSSRDVIRWEQLIAASAAGAEQPETVIAAQSELLRQMQRYCAGPRCRHRALVEYFGQTYEPANCGACDVCLDDVRGMTDATVTAQKILSCVARCGERFGAGHIAEVLVGGETEAVRRAGHVDLSTWGLLKELPRKTVLSMVYQLLDQGLLERTTGEYPVLRLNAVSWEVMRGGRPVMLLSAPAKVKRSRAEPASWEGVDRALFERLRQVRARIASERGVPAFVVFADTTLRELARVRPTTPGLMRNCQGVGEKKLAEFGERFLDEIRRHCSQTGLASDLVSAADAARATTRRVNPGREQAFRLFADGRSIREVAETIGRAESTTTAYLAEYIAERKPDSIAPWVDDATCSAVAVAAARFEDGRLKPIHEHLGGTVSYEAIRLVVAYLGARA